MRREGGDTARVEREDRAGALGAVPALRAGAVHVDAPQTSWSPGGALTAASRRPRGIIHNLGGRGSSGSAAKLAFLLGDCLRACRRRPVGQGSVGGGL